MKTLKFKTNIKCEGCLGKVTPALNKQENISAWNVDIYTPKKILTVETDSMNAEDIIKAVNEAGYNAEQLTEL